MVEGYQGRPGSGKTATMVARAFKAKERGRPVYANIPLVDKRKRKTQEFFFFGKLSVEPMCPRTYGASWSDGLITTLEEFLTLDNALVLLDEVHMWLPATEWASIPFEVRRNLAQQRKVGIDIWWSAQSNARVFNVVRELTACLWTCQRYGPLSVMVGVDPESRESMGKRFHLLGPSVWDLYNTEFMVGSADGSQEGRVGFNSRYHRVQETARTQGLQPGQRVLVRISDGVGDGARYELRTVPEPVNPARANRVWLGQGAADAGAERPAPPALVQVGSNGHIKVETAWSP